MSLLVICEIFAAFANTLTVDGKYSLHNSENLSIPIQMILSKKRKTFCDFFVQFLESILIFKYFGKTDDAHCFYIS